MPRLAIVAELEPRERDSLESFLMEAVGDGRRGRIDWPRTAAVASGSGSLTRAWGEMGRAKFFDTPSRSTSVRAWAHRPFQNDGKKRPLITNTRTEWRSGRRLRSGDFNARLEGLPRSRPASRPLDCTRARIPRARSFAGVFMGLMTQPQRDENSPAAPSPRRTEGEPPAIFWAWRRPTECRRLSATLIGSGPQSPDPRAAGAAP